MSTLDSPHVDPASVPYRPVSMRYGLIGSLALIALGLVFHIFELVDYTGQESNWLSSLLNWGVMIAIFVMAVRKHRDTDLGGYISFGRAFMVGFLAALIIAVITTVWTYLFFTVIEPDLIGNILEMTRENMATQQNMSEEQIDQALSFMGFMFTPGGMSLTAGFFTLLAGTFFSLIVAAVMKKNPPQFT